MQYQTYFKNTTETAVDTASEDYQVVKAARDAVRAAYDFLRDRYGKTRGLPHEIDAVIGHLAEALKDVESARAAVGERSERVVTEQDILEELNVDKEIADKLIKSGLFHLDRDALEKTVKTLEKTGD